MRSESSWVKILRAVTYGLLIGGIVGGLYGAYQAAETVNAWTEETSFASGTFLFIAAISIIATLISVAVIMIFLDMAADISITAHNSNFIAKDTAEMRRLLESTSGTGETVKCKRCKKSYNDSHKSCPSCFFEQDGELNPLD